MQQLIFTLVEHNLLFSVKSSQIFNIDCKEQTVDSRTSMYICISKSIHRTLAMGQSSPVLFNLNSNPAMQLKWKLMVKLATLV